MSAHTKATCPKSGNYLGNGQSFTVVDTPGFGDDQESKTLDDMVKVLRNDLRFVHVFVIMFNGQKPRLDESLKVTIKLLEDLFGPSFWPNVVIGVSRWAYYDDAIEERKEKGETEDIWIERLRNNLVLETNIDVSMSVN